MTNRKMTRDESVLPRYGKENIENLTKILYIHSIVKVSNTKFTKNQISDAYVPFAYSYSLHEQNPVIIIYNIISLQCEPKPVICKLIIKILFF